MNVGMLWFSNDPKVTLAEKIQRAAEYYRQKYGQQPDTCYIHPSENDGSRVDSIHVKTSPQVLPHHFWIGRNQDERN